MPQVPVPEFTEFPKLARSKRFKEAMEAAKSLRETIDELKVELEEQKKVIDEEFAAAEIGSGVSVSYSGWRVVVVDKQGSQSIDKKKLLSLLGPKGVEILKKSMKQGKPSHYVQLVSPKEDKDGGDASEE